MGRKVIYDITPGAKHKGSGGRERKKQWGNPTARNSHRQQIKDGNEPRGIHYRKYALFSFLFFFFPSRVRFYWLSLETSYPRSLDVCLLDVNCKIGLFLPCVTNYLSLPPLYALLLFFFFHFNFLFVTHTRFPVRGSFSIQPLVWPRQMLMYSMCNDKTQMSTSNVSILRFLSATSQTMIFLRLEGFYMGYSKVLYPRDVLPS